jgi:hypothetical protein
VVTPDCIRDAVLKPDAAGPTKAMGTIKHPDTATPSPTIKSNLLIIESLQKKHSIHLFIEKKGKNMLISLQLLIEFIFLNYLIFLQ